MAKTNNMQLSDDIMAKATGGIIEDERESGYYDTFGKVISKEGDGYLVRFGDGGEVLASFEQKHVVPEGTRVGLKALGGGWVMEEVTAPRNK
ncbi:MAG: hypothetical protein IJ873_02870 [Lachnospiraceae bacterium]|nr:hypothetical protein [Lachnospiraceae bacterium]